MLRLIAACCALLRLVAPDCGGGARAHLRSTPAALSSRRFCGPQRGRLSRAAACCGTRSWLLVRAFSACMRSGLVRLLGASPGLLRLIADYCRNKPRLVRLLGASPGPSGLLRLIAAITGLLRLIAAISLCESPGSSGLLRLIAFRQETFRQGKVSRRRQRGFQRLRHCGRRAAAVCKEEHPARLIAPDCGSLRFIAVCCGWYAPCR